MIMVKEFLKNYLNTPLEIFIHPGSGKIIFHTTKRNNYSQRELCNKLAGGIIMSTNQYQQ